MSELYTMQRYLQFEDLKKLDYIILIVGLPLLEKQQQQWNYHQKEMDTGLKRDFLNSITYQSL